jgi:hypothetical protein
MYICACMHACVMNEYGSSVVIRTIHMKLNVAKTTVIFYRKSSMLTFNFVLYKSSILLRDGMTCVFLLTFNCTLINMLIIYFLLS